MFHIRLLCECLVRRPSQLDECLDCEAVPEPFCSRWARENPRHGGSPVLNDTGRNPHNLAHPLFASRERPPGRGSRAPGLNLRSESAKKVQQALQHFDQRVRLTSLQVI
jgi:hypothetical protein